MRRERTPQEVMLLQVDGSHHPWLEHRGPRFVLLLAVDDATGAVANALFRPEEDTRGYFLLMDGIIRSYGIPLSIYGDRHGVFKFNGKPRHITQPVGPTQFTRAMGELGIEQIFARSPQAKRRVERMAGTLQDPSPWAQTYIDANPGIVKARRRTDLEPEWRLRRPVAVNVDADDRIVVLESYHHRLQIYNKLNDYEEPSINL